MVSICGNTNSESTLSSDDLASSDVFVKLSQHTSIEISDFTVFVIVFLSYYLHFQSFKYHVSEMMEGSQSLVEIFETLVSNEQKSGLRVLRLKRVFLFLVGFVIAILFFSLTFPVCLSTAPRTFQPN